MNIHGIHGYPWKFVNMDVHESICSFCGCVFCHRKQLHRDCWPGRKDMIEMFTAICDRDFGWIGQSRQKKKVAFKDGRTIFGMKFPIHHKSKMVFQFHQDWQNPFIFRFWIFLLSPLEGPTNIPTRYRWDSQEASCYKAAALSDRKCRPCRQVAIKRGSSQSVAQASHTVKIGKNRHKYWKIKEQISGN